MMRVNYGWRWMGFGLLAGALAVGAALGPAQGWLAWPEEWLVFAPFERDDAIPPASVLAEIPDQMTRPGGVEVEGRQVDLPRGERLDLNRFFPEPEVGNTAWVFAVLTSPDARTFTLGMGADWWFTAWLNGEKILDTDVSDAGNKAWPPSAADHTAEVTLRAGNNVLAVRVVSGAASALFAAGGPDEIRAVTDLIGSAEDPRRFNTRRPFAERIPFELDRQAFATAEMSVALPEAGADLSDGALVGLREMPKRQRWLRHIAGGRPELLDTEYREFPLEPVKLLLSKSQYPAEDRHLDAVLWTTPPEGRELSGSLDVILRDADGAVRSRQSIASPSRKGWFFSLGLPPDLNGGSAALEVRWHQDGEVIARAVEPFEVLPPADVAQSGRIPIRLINEPGATARALPFTVGVPFPHGALDDASRVRLVDDAGAALPLQTKITARWSRFGPVKWLLCDFTADLDGTPRELFLEYGDRASGIGRRESAAAVGRFSSEAGVLRRSPPEARTSAADRLADRRPIRESGATVADAIVDGRRWASMPVDSAHLGFPAIDAGRLRFGVDGLAFDAAGDGTYQRVLDAAALSGAFVTHEDGRTYRPDPATPFVIEESGPEKIVVRRAGWYVSVGSGQLAVDSEPDARFCNYVTRVVIHRDSPLVRIFHTWIFTGDGNRDRIAHMGWRFETEAPVRAGSLLNAFEQGDWLASEHLVQHDFEHYRLADGVTRPGRTPGVLEATVGDTRVLLGAKDFWQNFPSELGVDAAGFTFYNWPRHNPPASHERPIPPSTAYQLRFAHEGELLNFRLPDEYVEDPIWGPASGNGSEMYWEKGRPESVNAQGIARTEELVLYFTAADVSRDASARVLQGLNDETLRAVIDPVWMAASGAFGRIHHRDPETYPLDEHIYEQVCHAPARGVERLEFYGMWLHGDLPFWNVNLQNRGVSLYRTLRDNHQGWPVKWVPYARSGDPRLLKYAEAATRQLTDANFCHYASEEIDRQVGETFFRRQGRWTPSVMPWVTHNRGGGPSTRNISQDVDYLWDSYYLTGYRRAVDVLLLWSELVKIDTARINPGRGSVANMHVALDMYKATFDPWFLVTAHAFARMHRAVWRPEGSVERQPARTVGHFWKPADRDFYGFTGDAAHREVALNVSASWSSPWTYSDSWQILDVPYIEEATTAWHLTGDDYFLGRAAGYVDWANMAVYDAVSPEWYRGNNTRISGHAPGIFGGWYIQQLPLALGAFAQAGYRPDAVPNPFVQYPTNASLEAQVERDGETFRRVKPPAVLIAKPDASAMPFLLDTWYAFDLTYAWRVTGPDGAVVVEGEWDLKRKVPEIPAGTPSGIYRIEVEGLHPNPRWQWPGTMGAPFVPMAPFDVSEVMVFEQDETGTRVGGGRSDCQYWFKVPEGVRAFWLQMPDPRGLHRRTVWNPEGERVWDYEPPEGFADLPPGTLRIEIDVPPGQDGRLWRVSTPGGGGLTIDPVIPPYLSASRNKWFDPDV